MDFIHPMPDNYFSAPSRIECNIIMVQEINDMNKAAQWQQKDAIFFEVILAPARGQSSDMR
jgi:hypothetical protein